MALRITTWNVNSVRLRLSGIARLHDEQAPDVLCLQETKVRDELFPVEPLAALGYRHHVLYGQPGYHGVAIFAKQPFEVGARTLWCGKNDCRHLHIKLAGDLDLHNFYIPAGGDVPDPEVNEKFKHKLDFLAAVTSFFTSNPAGDRAALLVGDLNIAPLETDVWSHKQLLKVVSHTPVETAALAGLQASWDWVDMIRQVIPPAERLYSWWSYRARDWSASDRGRRLDHIWATPNIRHRLRSAGVLRAARGWDQPSDHVPVTIELDDR